MPLLKNNHIVFDFETTGTNPFVCDAVQIAAVVMDADGEILDDSHFNMFIRPDNINDEHYLDEIYSTIVWHASNYKTSPDEIVKKWMGGQSPKLAMSAFAKYCESYFADGNTKKKRGAPVLCGMNLHNFDMIILRRMADKYGLLDKEQNISFLNPIYTLDLMQTFYMWFGKTQDYDRLSLNYMREKLGLSQEGAHDALKDVIDTAKILGRFIKMYRQQLKPRVKFEGSFSE